MLHDMNYVPSKEVDPDVVWMRPAVKENGFEHFYEHVLCYVDDDVLCMTCNPMTTMKELQAKFMSLKGDKIAEPED
jgi:hypothetical protein